MDKRQNTERLYIKIEYLMLVWITIKGIINYNVFLNIQCFRVGRKRKPLPWNLKILFASIPVVHDLSKQQQVVYRQDSMPAMKSILKTISCCLFLEWNEWNNFVQFTRRIFEGSPFPYQWAIHKKDLLSTYVNTQVVVDYEWERYHNNHGQRGIYYEIECIIS